MRALGARVLVRLLCRAEPRAERARVPGVTQRVPAARVAQEAARGDLGGDGRARLDGRHQTEVEQRDDHQEAMAHGVVNILASNYDALEAVFRGMGVLDPSKADLRRPGTDEPFALALRRCMSGEAATPPPAAVPPLK